MTCEDAVVRALAARGWALPPPKPPIGLYDPCRLDRGTGYLAGQWATEDGLVVYTGRVGVELTLAEGKRAAELAALNALGTMHRALGGFDQLRSILRVEGHVASAEDFFDQPEVLDAASEVFHVALGERGRHARAAFAPARLPKNHSIKLLVTFAYDEDAV